MLVSRIRSADENVKIANMSEKQISPAVYYALGAPGGLAILTHFVDRMADGIIQSLVVNYAATLHTIWSVVDRHFPDIDFDFVKYGGVLTVQVITWSMVAVGLLNTGFRNSLFGQLVERGAKVNSSILPKAMLSIAVLVTIVTLIDPSYFDDAERFQSEGGTMHRWILAPILLVPFFNWRAPIVLFVWAGSFFAADYVSALAGDWLSK